MFDVGGVGMGISGDKLLRVLYPGGKDAGEELCEGGCSGDREKVEVKTILAKLDVDDSRGELR